MVNIIEGFKKRRGPSFDLKYLALIKTTWSKLNTGYWTFTVLDFTVELGWHAFYNQLLLTREPATSFTVFQTMRFIVETPGDPPMGIC